MSQPKALFLADVMHNDPCSAAHHDEAAAELRRLHTLLEAEQALHQRVTYPELRRLAKVEAQRDALLEFAQEVRRSGGTRLASMAIAIIAKAEVNAAIKAVEGEKT